MSDLPWLDAIEHHGSPATPGRVRVMTPDAGGTGMVCLVSATGDILAVFRDNMQGLRDARLAQLLWNERDRLCRATRELYAAAETALEYATTQPGIDPESKAARELRAVLDRWRQGGPMQPAREPSSVPSLVRVRRDRDDWEPGRPAWPPTRYGDWHDK